MLGRDGTPPSGPEWRAMPASFIAVRHGIAVGLACALAASCSNDPYPESDRGQKVYYTTYQEAPRTLDPATSYNVTEHEITGNIYEGLVEYHFLKRPHELIPALAEAI